MTITFIAVGAGVVALILLYGVWSLMGAVGERRDIRQRLDPRLAVPTGAAPSDILRREKFSDIPRMDTLLKRLSLSGTIGVMLAQAGLKVSVATMLYIHLFVAALTMLLLTWWVRYPLGTAAPIGLVAGLILPLFYIRRRRKQRLRTFAEQFSGTLDLIKSSLGAGHSLNYALEVATEELPEPMAGELRTVLEEMRLGLAVKNAFENLHRRVPVNELRFFMLAIVLTREVGGNLSEVLGTLATGLRERKKLRQKVQALSAQGKASAGLLFCIPFAIALLANWLNPGFMTPLFTTRGGHMALAVAAGFQLAAFLLIRTVVNPKELALE